MPRAARVPAPSSARHGSSQRQGMDVERAVKILERLAAAPEKRAFVLQPEQDCCLAAVGPVLSLLMPSAAAAGAPGHVLLAAWVAAVARGMQLAAQQLDDRVSLLCNLVAHISNCFFIVRHLEEPAVGPADDIDRAQVALSVLAVQSGMVKAHEQLSLRLNSIIISHQQAASSGGAATQQQRQEQQMDPGLARLATQLLNLLTSMGRAWPGDGGLFSRALCPAVPAAASLAAAVLRSSETPAGAGITSWQAATENVVLLCDAYQTAGSNVPVQIAGSSSVGALLLMALGLATERLHQVQRGLTPAAAVAGEAGVQQQRLAVPAYHSQLLQALGVAAGGASLAATLHDPLWRHVLQSLIATTEKRQRLTDAAEAASCQQPLLLVLLECVLLDPAAQLVQGVSMTLRLLLARCECTAYQLGAALQRAVLERDACRRALVAATPAAVAAAPAPAAATPAPAAATAPAAAVFGGAGGNLSVLEVLMILSLDINMHLFSWQLTLSIADGDDAAFSRLLTDVAAVWLEHTAQCASLLEAGLRLLRNDQFALRWAACVPHAVGAAARARRRAGSSGAMAEDSQQRVFALLLSCLKTVTAAAPAHQGSSTSTDGAVVSESAQEIHDAAVALVAVICACASLLQPSSSDSGGSSSQTSRVAPAAAAAGFNAQLGCVLLARCLVAASPVLLQLAQQAPARDGPQQMLLQIRLLSGCRRATAMLGQQLPRQVTAAATEPGVLQRLLAEHAALQQQLDSLLHSQFAASAGQTLLPASMPARVAKQLRAFGVAVCAALPVQQCCNHHDCSNLGQASELELVGGKSCVCGGCREARYCSRECQVAHYKGWHKAACKRLQQRYAQQQPAGSSEAAQH